MEHYDKELEKSLLDMVQQKESADKRLLTAEVFIGVSATLLLFALIFVAAFAQIEVWLKIFLIAIGFVFFLSGCFFALRLEQLAGYYECKACRHRYVPTFKAVTLAQHLGRTRYMRCPECDAKTWQIKVLRKD